MCMSREKGMDMNKEWLMKKYWGERLSLAEIGIELGCSRYFVHRRMKELGIPIRSRAESHKGKEHQKNYPQLYDAKWLRKKYEEERLSISQIANEVGCSCETVRYALIKTEVKIRTISESQTGRYKYPELHDEDWLKEMYLENEMTQAEIASVLGCDRSHVGDMLRSLGIPIRKEYNTREKNPLFKHVKACDRAFLWQRYIVERKSTQEIGKEIGCSSSTILRGLKASGVPIRTCKELWRDTAYIKRVYEGLNAKPNKLEKRVDKALQKYIPAEWRYNGDFSCGISIGGLVPDFVNVNSKKLLIEVFGNIYHDERLLKAKFKDTLAWNRTEFGRKAVYSQLGYPCLVLWESDIKKMSEEEIAEAVRDFMGGYKK